MIRNVTSFCVHEHKMTTNLSISSPRNMASYMGSQNMQQDIECDFPLPNQSMYMDAPDSGKLSRLRESSISAISSILRRPRGIDGSMVITSRELSCLTNLLALFPYINSTQCATPNPPSSKLRDQSCQPHHSLHLPQ